MYVVIRDKEFLKQIDKDRNAHWTNDLQKALLFHNFAPYNKEDADYFAEELESKVEEVELKLKWDY
jgi:hypothetical protein